MQYYSNNIQSNLIALLLSIMGVCLSFCAEDNSRIWAKISGQLGLGQGQSDQNLIPPAEGKGPGGVNI